MQAGTFPMVEQLLIRSLTCLYGFQDAFEMCYLEEEKGKKAVFKQEIYFFKKRMYVLFHLIILIFKLQCLKRCALATDCFSSWAAKYKIVSFGSSIIHPLWKVLNVSVVSTPSVK